MSQTKSSIPSIYNPNSLTKDEIKSSFVIRKKEFQRIFDAVKVDDMSKPGQHFVIQGQRGTGKTTLLLMLKYTIKDDAELNKWLIPVMFNEEQYNITKLYKLWESIARYLEEEDESRNFYGLEEEMKSHTEKEEYEPICFDILNNALEKRGKKLLLLIDNFGDMVSKFKTKERQRLREILTANSNFKIIGGTAVTLIFQANYSHPFFEFFKIISLEGLTKDETIDLLRKFGEINKDADKINKLLTEKPEQVEALRLLTGGVPRTIALLYEIFVDSESGESFKDLEILIDRITPLYKDRLDDMPPSQQEIIDALALNWDAMTVKEIAAQTRMKSKEISVHINRMVKDNIVLKIDTTTKNYLYIIQERFLNIWYLMRYGNKKSENRVKWLTQFLECWLNEDEIVGFGERFKSVMKTGAPYSKYVLYMTSAIAETKAYAFGRDTLIESAKAYLLKTDPALVAELPKLDEDLFFEGGELFKNHKYKASIEKLSKIKNKTKEVYFNLGLCSQLINHIANALEYYTLSSNLGFSDSMCNLAVLYAEESKDYQKAEKYYLMAVEQDDTSAMYDLAILYESQYKDYVKAEKYYLMAVKKGDVSAMYNLALMYKNKFNNFESAEKYYLLAIEQGYVRAMFNLAYMYENDCKDFKMAEKYYLMAIEKSDSSAMYNLALIYDNEYKDYRQAEKYYLMAVEKGHASAVYNLALLYDTEFKDYKKAEKYYLMAIEDDNIGGYNNLAILYDTVFKDYQKAEKYYLLAIEKDSVISMFNLGLLYREHLNERNKSIGLFEKASDRGYTKAKINLILEYFKAGINKSRTFELSNELMNNEKSLNQFEIILLLHLICLLWNDKIEDVFKIITEENVEISRYFENYNVLLNDFLLILIAKKQIYFVYNIFRKNENDIVDKLKPIYYAVLYLLKDEFPDEHKKMGSELKPVVDDILKKIKEMEVKYA